MRSRFQCQPEPLGGGFSLISQCRIAHHIPLVMGGSPLGVGTMEPPCEQHHFVVVLPQVVLVVLEPPEPPPPGGMNKKIMATNGIRARPFPSLNTRIHFEKFNG